MKTKGCVLVVKERSAVAAKQCPHGGASGNRDESLLTRLQYINLCFHFEVEQQVNGVFCNFFGFNGTAGVWRITALEESGRRFARDDNRRGHGHCSRDWKSMFLNDCQQGSQTIIDLEVSMFLLPSFHEINHSANSARGGRSCLCEVPESYEAYRKQQRRWHSGPVQLFHLCLLRRQRFGVSSK
ncbi:hypothetical protein B296_00016345 [Ensete ventricosum]|uniref:Uncharacterized protein n=1 Tax=Ensete ventricosum TaxID=4639 RepID=A0A426ZM39_ENSVE|nr:hypothetical protein B296_00016345 [Ensete ventricosum]